MTDRPDLLKPHLEHLERRMRDLLDCQSERRAILLNIDRASGAATGTGVADLTSAHCVTSGGGPWISSLIAAVDRFCQHVRDGLARPADPFDLSSIGLLIENAADLAKWASELIIATELVRIGAQRGASNPAGRDSAPDREAAVLQLTATVQAIQAVVVALSASSGLPASATPGEDAITLPAPLYHAGGRLAGPGAPLQSSGTATRVQAS